jgi:hypothetical protein
LSEQYRSLSISLFSLLYSPITSSLIGPNILLNALFSNTIRPRSCLNMSDHVSHPYKTTDKIILVLWSMRFECWMNKATKNTLKICNTYCFSTKT